MVPDLNGEGIAWVIGLLALLAATDQVAASLALVPIEGIDVVGAVAFVGGLVLEPVVLLSTQAALAVGAKPGNLVVALIAPVLL